MGHLLPFPNPHGGVFVTFYALLKLIPTHTPGWGRWGEIGVYFDWCHDKVDCEVEVLACSFKNGAIGQDTLYNSVSSSVFSFHGPN